LDPREFWQEFLRRPERDTLTIHKISKKLKEGLYIEVNGFSRLNVLDASLNFGVKSPLI
jgi:hypothetical protein